MNFIEGIHYVRQGNIRTLLKDYVHDRQIPGLEQYSTRVMVAQMPDIVWATLDMGRLTVHEGAQWDGASGPTKDSWFGGDVNADRGPLVHDYLYAVSRQILGEHQQYNDSQYRLFHRIADREFLHCLEQDGMPRFRRWYWYRAVRMFGFSHLTNWPNWQSGAES